MSSSYHTKWPGIHIHNNVSTIRNIPSPRNSHSIASPPQHSTATSCPLSRPSQWGIGGAPRAHHALSTRLTCRHARAPCPAIKPDDARRLPGPKTLSTTQTPTTNTAARSDQNRNTQRERKEDGLSDGELAFVLLFFPRPRFHARAESAGPIAQLPAGAPRATADQAATRTSRQSRLSQKPR